MRKVSKNRGEDDIISSTNGSMMNEDNMESGVQVAESESPDLTKELSKKRKSTKARSKKRKSGRGESDDVDIQSNEANDDGISSTNGSIAKTHDDSGELDKDEDLEEDIADDKSDDEEYKEGPDDKKKRLSKAKSNKSRKSGSGKKETEEYEVEKIMGSKKIKGKLHFLIRWKGYSSDDDTWEPEKTVSCPDLISKYYDEKENSKNKEKTPKKKKSNLKRKSKSEAKISPKRPKNNWDSENADSNAEYEVERILEVHHKKDGKREFLIHWKGWSTKFDSWEPESNLNCPELIKKFMAKVDDARSVENRNLRPAPETTNRFTLQDPTHGRRLSKRRGQRQRVRYDNAE